MDLIPLLSPFDKGDDSFIFKEMLYRDEQRRFSCKDSPCRSVMYAKQYDLYFVGTYLPSLEIPDDFEWSEESGPVHGSKQFVKCKNLEEVERVMKLANLQR